jgi:hypothetical protein
MQHQIQQIRIKLCNKLVIHICVYVNSAMVLDGKLFVLTSLLSREEWIFILYEVHRIIYKGTLPLPLQPT